MDDKPVIELASSGNDICSGCGGYTPDGGRTGNLNIKHFRLNLRRNHGMDVTYCQECAAKVAQFLLQAWEE